MQSTVARDESFISQWPPGFQMIVPGDRVCVTHLSDMRNHPQGPVVYPAGLIAVGTVRNVDPDGFFDLYTDAGKVHGYYVNDTSLRIKVLDRDDASASEEAV